jgi:hypothetical protein
MLITDVAGIEAVREKFVPGKLGVLRSCYLFSLSSRATLAENHNLCAFCFYMYIYIYNKFYSYIYNIEYICTLAFIGHLPPPFEETLLVLV